MTYRQIMTAVAAVALIAGGAARANDYRPGDFLLLDLQQAVMSPKPIGPPAQFEHVQIEAKTEAGPEAKPESGAVRTPVAAARAVPVAKAPRQAATKTRSPARTRVVRSRGNPLDAYAADTRVQVWPCRSGGICNWQK